VFFGSVESAGLEIRAAKGGSRIVSGSFPYNSRAVLSDGGKSGRPRKEYFANDAFKYSVETGDLDIHFLSGHDFGKALASRNSGSLTLQNTSEALLFEAELSADVLATSHGQDFIRMMSAGLVGGISPGFRLPAQATVPDAEEVFEEDPSEGRALIRKINQAVLYELSAVTRPAYSETSVDVESRNWQPTARIQTNRANPRYRWRL
jgi:HK97 family phage prohead protease